MHRMMINTRFSSSTASVSNGLSKEHLRKQSSQFQMDWDCLLIYQPAMDWDCLQNKSAILCPPYDTLHRGKRGFVNCLITCCIHPQHSSSKRTTWISTSHVHFINLTQNLLININIIPIKWTQILLQLLQSSSTNNHARFFWFALSRAFCWELAKEPVASIS